MSEHRGLAAAILAGGRARRLGEIDKSALTIDGAGIRERNDRGERQAAHPPGGIQVIEVGAEELAAFDPHGLLFVNVNTPHDYAQARRRLDSRSFDSN